MEVGLTITASRYRADGDRRRDRLGVLSRRPGESRHPLLACPDRHPGRAPVPHRGKRVAGSGPLRRHEPARSLTAALDPGFLGITELVRGLTVENTILVWTLGPACPRWCWAMHCSPIAIGLDASPRAGSTTGDELRHPGPAEQPDPAAQPAPRLLPHPALRQLQRRRPVCGGCVVERGHVVHRQLGWRRPADEPHDERR